MESVSLVVESLLSQLPEESAPAVIVVKPERPSPASRANGKADASQSKYDPGMMYLLELATIITLRDDETLEALGERLLTSLQAFIRDARNLHSLALSRIIYYLLNLLRLSHVWMTKFSPSRKQPLKLANFLLGSFIHACACCSTWHLRI